MMLFPLRGGLRTSHQDNAALFVSLLHGLNTYFGFAMPQNADSGSCVVTSLARGP